MCKVQYLGFMAFCGYRKEGLDFFRLDTDLRLTLDGPVAGVGLVF